MKTKSEKQFEKREERRDGEELDKESRRGIESDRGEGEEREREREIERESGGRERGNFVMKMSR